MGENKPGGRIDRFPDEQKGAHPDKNITGASKPVLSNQETERQLLESFGVQTVETTHQIPSLDSSNLNDSLNPNRPVFGETNPNTSTVEQEDWKTLGIDTWFYDSPMWDPDRVRLGRIDKPTNVRVIQEVRGTNGRLAQQVAYRGKDKDGKEYESKFWVHPKSGGYDGMPKKPNQQKTLDLK